MAVAVVEAVNSLLQSLHVAHGSLITVTSSGHWSDKKNRVLPKAHFVVSGESMSDAADKLMKAAHDGNAATALSSQESAEIIEIEIRNNAVLESAHG